MSADFAPELRPELLDDFYVECDELLTSSRAALLQLEAHLASPAIVATQIEALFRHIHSIKGNCAIVGLRAGEELAHGMEDLLRALAKKKFPLTARMIDALLSAAQRLEQIVTSHRLARPLPEIADALAPIRALAGASSGTPFFEVSSPPGAAPAEVISPETDALARGLTLWRCTFAPTPALDQRGVNVSSVRARLGTLGDVIRATPSVRGKGIVFDFVLASRAVPEISPSWEEDGIPIRTCRPSFLERRSPGPGVTQRSPFCGVQ